MGSANPHSPSASHPAQNPCSKALGLCAGSLEQRLLPALAASGGSAFALSMAAPALLSAFKVLPAAELATSCRGACDGFRGLSAHPKTPQKFGA